MTREDIARAISRANGLLLDKSKDLVDQILEQICAALEKGENVTIVNFGSFEIRQKPARMGRNPATMKPVPITARKVVIFHVSRNARGRITAASRRAG